MVVRTRTVYMPLASVGNFRLVAEPSTVVAVVPADVVICTSAEACAEPSGWLGTHSSVALERVA